MLIWPPLVSGLRWGFFRREQKQVPCCYNTTPWSCRKPVNVCQQPWVCKHPSADKQWGVHPFWCLLQISKFSFHLSHRGSWVYSSVRLNEYVNSALNPFKKKWLLLSQHGKVCITNIGGFGLRSSFSFILKVKERLKERDRFLFFNLSGTCSCTVF